MTPALPTSHQQPSLQDIIRPHVGITTAGGSYRCTCLHTYEAVVTVDDTRLGAVKHGHTDQIPDPDQRLIIDELHAQHIAERLLAAGVEPPRPKDPRQALRDRLGR